MSARTRRLYGCLATVFVAFAVWGSWFPFRIRPLPLDYAAHLFWVAGGVDYAPLSMTDAVSNLLLFVPIGLFGAAALHRTGIRGSAVMIVTTGALMSVVLEFGQAFIPWRTPSVFDVAAETTGTAAGFAIWRIAAIELDRAVASVTSAWRQAGAVERLLWVYAAAFAWFWLLPFDFTLRPDEIGDKYFHKRLLLPFTPSPDAASSAQLLVNAMAAMPIGLAGVICGNPKGVRRSFAGGYALTALALFVLTVLQVPVFSRTTDMTVSVAALGGLAAGAALAARDGRAQVRGLPSSAVRVAVVTGLWLAAVAAVEWWPYRFDPDIWRAQQQVIAWANAPFRAIPSAADVLPGAALAAAAGTIARRHLVPAYARLQVIASLTIVGLVYLSLEAGRLLLPGATPSLAPVVLKTCAFAAALAFSPGPPPVNLPERAQS